MTLRGKTEARFSPGRVKLKGGTKPGVESGADPKGEAKQRMRIRAGEEGKQSRKVEQEQNPDPENRETERTEIEGTARNRKRRNWKPRR